MPLLDKIFGAFSHGVDFDIAEDQIFTLGDAPTILAPIPEGKYRCKFITKSKGKIVVGICIIKGLTLNYEKDDIVSLTYEEFQKTYVVAGKIENIIERYALSEDDTAVFKNFIDDGTLRLSELLLVSIVLTSTPKPYQRRSYVRQYFPSWEILFKVRDPANNDYTKISSIQRELIESGKFEIKAKEYCVLNTLDISGGGFRGQVALEIPVNAVIDCIIMMDNQEYGATGVVLDYIKANQMRVQFTHISTATRDNILKNIFAYERMSKRKLK